MEYYSPYDKVEVSTYRRLVPRGNTEKGFRVGLKDCVAAAPAVADWRVLERRRMKVRTTRVVCLCQA